MRIYLPRLLLAGLMLTLAGQSTAQDAQDARVGGRWSFEGALSNLELKGDILCEYAGTLDLNQSPNGELSGTAELGLVEGDAGCPDPINGPVEGFVGGLDPFKGLGTSTIGFSILDTPTKGEFLVTACGTANNDFMDGGWSTAPIACLFVGDDDDDAPESKGAELFGGWEARRIRSTIPTLGPLGLGGLAVVLTVGGLAALQRRRRA